MAWIDDRIWCHPKLTDLSDRAFRVHVNSIAYASGFSTKGHLSPGQMKAIGTAPRDLRELIAAGLWEPTENGVYIHDWDVHNGKRDARKEADRERKRQERSAGQSAGQSRGTSAGHNPGQSAGASAGQSTVLSALGPRVRDRRRAPDDRSDGSEEDQEQDQGLSSKTQIVYDHWRLQRGKTRANYDHMSKGRRAKIKTRLAEFTVFDLKAAIDGVARDPWPDRGLHDDLTIIFRSREQVEKFLEMTREAMNGTSAAGEPPEAFRARIAALDAQWQTHETP